MSKKKLWVSALTLAGVSLFSQCQAQFPNSNDWTAQNIVIFDEYEYTDVNGTASADASGVKVRASAPAFGDSGYVTATFDADFIHTPNGGAPEPGPDTLETTETDGVTGTAAGAGWGYSHSAISDLGGFCPSNYSKSGTHYGTYSLDSNNNALRVRFVLLAKAIVANSAEAMLLRPRSMVCRKQQPATGSASTSAEATVVKGGT